MPHSSVLLLWDTPLARRLQSLAPQLSLETAYPTIGSLSDWQQNEFPFLLAIIDDKLQLLSSDKKQQPLVVDFLDGSMGYRGQQNVRNEMVVKAVLGRDKQHLPSVIDATAGMGRDSFLLAVLGCRVTMVERSPVVFALLSDGLARYQQAGDAQIADRLSLCHADFVSQWDSLMPAEVVYLDPMFPKREKSALVKKEMRFFKAVVGADADSDQLLLAAKKCAQKKVVVKRPSKAECLAGAKPTYSLTGRSSRFDIYQC